jgi:adenylate cyclase
MTMPRDVDRRIVILDIDEKSLGEIGRWPWSRNVMAGLIDKLFDRYGIAVLGFDVVWAERDPSSGIDVLDELARRDLKPLAEFQSIYRKLRPALDFDARFAASLKGRPVVLAHYFNRDEHAERVNAIPAPVLPAGTFAGRRVYFQEWKGYTGNLPLYLANAAGAGHINPMVDFDGVLRRVPLFLEFDGGYYESLSLAMVRTLIGLQTGQVPPVQPDLSPDHPDLEWLRVGDLDIPVDNSAAALVPFRGKGGNFPYFSLADVIKDRVTVEQLKGRIVLIGTTAPGLHDLRTTPVAAAYPGVEIHANLIAGMIDRDLKERPLYMLGAEIVVVLLAGALLSILIPTLSALWATLASVLAVALIAALNIVIWNGGLVLPLASSLLMVAMLYTMNMAYGYFVESRSKRQLAERFGEYVPPELVDRMARDPGRYTMAPKSAELTILFSDVRGFTSISEALQPDELREYINEYLTSMSAIIRAQHRGTLDKYIGDAIMAFWGAPVEDAQHARNGVLAALAMQAECQALNGRFRARGWPTLQIGVGLNSGTVRVGDMGSQVRRAYTAMGDAVNVASRLEGRTKYYGVGILVGEATRKLAGGEFVFREIDLIKVKGKDEAVRIYQPLGSAPRDQGLWEAALQAYRARDWAQAEASLAELLRGESGCELYALYARRVAEKRRDPPLPGWDGVTVFDEK